MWAGIPNEKKCEVCGCMFVNKEDTKAVRCSSCVGMGPEAAGPNEKFIYQDVKRSDIESKLNLCLSKLDTVIRLVRGDQKSPEFSHKCDTCGSVFVSDAAASKYCPDCKAAKAN